MTTYLRRSRGLRWLIGCALTAFVLMWGIPGTRIQEQPEAQTALNTTTLSAAVTTADGTVVNLTSGTTVAAGQELFVDRELMRIQSAVGGSTTQWNVVRGIRGTASTHANAATVFTGVTARFNRADVVAGTTCTAANELYFPRINATSGQIAECEAGFWAVWSNDPVAVRTYTVRDEFNGGQTIMQDDGTAKSLADAEENFVYGSPLGAIEYREDIAKTISSWVAINGSLEISADDAAESVEIVLGASSDAALNQVLEVGTNGGCVAMMVTVSAITMVDELHIGWRQNEAFVDVAAFETYDEYATIGLKDNAGDLDIQDEEAGAGVQNDDTGITWAAGERRGLKVCISAGGVPTFYYTAASPHATRPAWIQATSTNTGDALTAADGMVPFLVYTGAGVAGTITIQWVEITRLP